MVTIIEVEMQRLLRACLTAGQAWLVDSFLNEGGLESKS